MHPPLNQQLHWHPSRRIGQRIDPALRELDLGEREQMASILTSSITMMDSSMAMWIDDSSLSIWGLRPINRAWPNTLQVAIKHSIGRIHHGRGRYVSGAGEEVARLQAHADNGLERRTRIGEYFNREAL